METLIIVVAAPIINILVEYAKKKRGFNGKTTLVLVSVCIATVYLALKLFIPDELEANATEFIGQAGLLAVLIYEFIVKNVLPSKE